MIGPEGKSGKALFPEDDPEQVAAEEALEEDSLFLSPRDAERLENEEGELEKTIEVVDGLIASMSAELNRESPEQMTDQSRALPETLGVLEDTLTKLTSLRNRMVRDRESIAGILADGKQQREPQ